MIILGAVSLWVLSLAPPGEPARGVVVEEVESGFAAHRAGLAPGDVLTSWERSAAPPAHPEAARGELRSPFDSLWIEREEGPLGAVTLRGTRYGRSLEIAMPAGEWRLRVRPRLAERELATYEDGKRLVASGDPANGFAAWNDLVARLRASGDGAAARWLLLREMEAAAGKRAWDVVERARADAASDALAVGDLEAFAILQSTEGEAARMAGEWDRASTAFGKALHAYAALEAPTLGEPWVLNRLGRVAMARAQNVEAEELYMRALKQRNERAPESTDVAMSYLNLGWLAFLRGDPERAEDQTRRALALYQRLGDEYRVGSSLGNLASFATNRGDLASAEEYLRRDLEINAPLRSHTRDFGIALSALGDIARHRGDLTLAEDYWRRALAVQESVGDELEVANALHSLSGVALERGELDDAADSSERALAIFGRLTPGTGFHGSCLTRRGMIAERSGDLVAAEGYLRRGLEAKEKAEGESRSVRYTLNQLASLEIRRGSLARAQRYLEHALAIEERVGTLPDDVGLTRRLLGDLALANGQLAAAASYYTESREQERQLAPGRLGEAESCARLAAVHRQLGEPSHALEDYFCALGAIETLRNRLGGGDEAQSQFTARQARHYEETVDLLLEMGRPEEAYHVVERYRAQGLLALLAERDLLFAADVAPELAREQRAADAAHDSTVAKLAAAHGEQAESLRAELAGIRRRQAAARDAIRVASPRFAALQYPQPLDVAATRGVLDPGTVLLSYLIGEHTSHLFVVGPGDKDFVVVSLAVDRAALRAEVSQLRELLQNPGKLGRARLEAISRRLSDELLLPAGEPIRRAERLLILPDGPLHLIPFGALADPSSPKTFHYLAEAKPAHVAASATVFAELKKTRREGRAGQLLAFADPDYSSLSGGGQTAAAPAELRSAQQHGLELRPLPGARREAMAIAELHPGARVYIGREATEENFKAVAKDGSLIHLACHGLADESSPMDSSLALALPGKWDAGHENGLLQVWEIFDQVRLDADLVTLSACSTALGKEMSGEGVLGLTRAFQYAGARTVLASLWEVNDASTARLMEAFYRHLAAGRSKDVALQLAQRELLRDPATAHPHHWAAFQLSGDWR
jgi:CHAT domain-containing protein/Tfp pilus assembly protein PilF